MIDRPISVSTVVPLPTFDATTGAITYLGRTWKASQDGRVIKDARLLEKICKQMEYLQMNTTLGDQLSGLSELSIVFGQKPTLYRGSNESEIKRKSHPGFATENEFKAKNDHFRTSVERIRTLVMGTAEQTDHTQKEWNDFIDRVLTTRKSKLDKRPQTSEEWGYFWQVYQVVVLQQLHREVEPLVAKRELCKKSAAAPLISSGATFTAPGGPSWTPNDEYQLTMKKMFLAYAKNGTHYSSSSLPPPFLPSSPLSSTHPSVAVSPSSLSPTAAPSTPPRAPPPPPPPAAPSDH